MSVGSRETVIETPEGLELAYGIPGSLSRGLAWLVDTLVIVFVIGVPALLLMDMGFVLLGKFVAGFWGGAVLFLGHVWMECRRGGQTIGKRMVDIQVIDFEGGPLSIESIFIRNAMRLVDHWLPPLVLLGALDDERWWWGFPWAAVLFCFPWFSPERRRFGDLLAGTVVVLSPRIELRKEITAAKESVYRFTRTQLGVYGVKELQALAKVLRQPPGPIRREQEKKVANLIRAKIDYQGTIKNPHAFLETFFVQQREFLEDQSLMGAARQSKD